VVNSYEEYSKWMTDAMTGDEPISGMRRDLKVGLAGGIIQSGMGPRKSQFTNSVQLYTRCELQETLPNRNYSIDKNIRC
jgi:hypothetical protein